MKKKNLIISIMVIALMLISCSTALCEVKDVLKAAMNQAENKAEANNSQTTEPKVVTTTIDDTSLVSTQKSDKNTTLTPIQTATSVASGLIASGTTDKSVVMATLVSYGYEVTEAEIAYAKALTSDMLVAPTTTTTTGDPATELATTESETTVPTIDPETRVQQTLTKPNMKFADTTQVTQDGVDTVTTMLGEGYTVEQIAEGFVANGYTSETSAAVFKAAGVSSSDAYTALSSVAVKQAETNIDQEVKPTAKFKLSDDQIKADQDQAKQDAKQDAIKTSINDLEAAGYDVQETLDTAVQDLKDTGMSAQDAKDYLISKVADAKPQTKFYSTNNQMTSYGDGETALATAMIKSGYSSSEVSTAFQTGTYSYTSADTQKIVSAAENNIAEQTATLTPATSETSNANEEDILRRNTQAIPI